MKKKQCGNNYEAWRSALSEGFLPHSYGNLRTKDQLDWYDADFSPLEGEVLEAMRRGWGDGARVGRVVYTYEVPVAIELVTAAGEAAWLINTRKYSRTSSKHRNFVAHVLRSVAREHVMSLDAWVIGAQLPVEHRDTYVALLPEWHGSYEELAKAAASL